MDTLRISGTIEESIVDGPGVRFVIFTQGCVHNCKGCHNPETHDFDGGFNISINLLIEKFRKNPLLSGVTLSGGEPVCQAEALCVLARAVHEMGKNVIMYSGFTYEQILALPNASATELLTLTDILIDGKYIEDQKDLMLRFRGSANQRVIDVNSSFMQEQIIQLDW